MGALKKVPERLKMDPKGAGKGCKKIPLKNWEGAPRGTPGDLGRVPKRSLEGPGKGKKRRRKRDGIK
jgi:hypothetical protein